MKLLAIDTSTEACSVALQCGDEVCCDHRLVPQQHAQLLLPMIDELMATAGLTARQLDGVVFGRGPGSFTGVRIAASVVQGIAYGADLGTLGLSTLQALAQGCVREFDDQHVFSALDARMQQVYWCAYECNDLGLMQPVAEELVCDPIKVPTPACAASGLWALTGSGIDHYAEQILERAGLASRGKLRLNRWPHAQDLLTLAADKRAATAFLSAEHAVPVYLRNRVALTELERSSGQRL